MIKLHDNRHPTFDVSNCSDSHTFICKKSLKATTGICVIPLCRKVTERFSVDS